MSALTPEAARAAAEWLTRGVYTIHDAQTAADFRAEADRLEAAAKTPGVVFRAGDPEPAGVWAVLDAAGQVWQRDAEHTGWVWGEDWVTWMALTYSHGPLVEIVLPEPVTA